MLDRLLSCSKDWFWYCSMLKRHREALIARSAKLRREGEGGVLVKISKPQQDRRLDLPSIGPDTVRQCLFFADGGIAIESGPLAYFPEPWRTVAVAEAGLFITGLELVMKVFLRNGRNLSGDHDGSCLMAALKKCGVSNFSCWWPPK